MNLREYFESDIRFYYAIGVFLILVYITAIAITAILELLVIDKRIIPLTIGFFLFMFVYFVSISVEMFLPD